MFITIHHLSKIREALENLSRFLFWVFQLRNASTLDRATCRLPKQLGGDGMVGWWEHEMAACMVSVMEHAPRSKDSELQSRLRMGGRSDMVRLEVQSQSATFCHNSNQYTCIIPHYTRSFKIHSKYCIK